MSDKRGTVRDRGAAGVRAGGCGQKGPLYLPDEARDVVTRPATRHRPEPEAPNSPETVDSPDTPPSPAPEVTAPAETPPADEPEDARKDEEVGAAAGDSA